MAHSTAIANEFLKRANNDSKRLTQMQLQKLVYIAHGWNLVINQRPLTDDPIQAWDYGPVYPALWQTLNRYGKKSVDNLIKVSEYDAVALFRGDQISEEQLSPEDEQVINEVYQAYSDFHAFQLSERTHASGTPWHQIYIEKNHRRGTIDNDRIKCHFESLAA